MTERARKVAYGELAEQIDRNWSEISDRLMMDPEAITEMFLMRNRLRSASEVPLSPSGEAAEVRPGRERLRTEEVGRGVLPPLAGQGPAASDGSPPAPVSRVDVTAAGSLCDAVMTWVNQGFPGDHGDQLHLIRYRDHLHDCASCSENVRLRIAEEEARTS